MSEAHKLLLDVPPVVPALLRLERVCLSDAKAYFSRLPERLRDQIAAGASEHDYHRLVLTYARMRPDLVGRHEYVTSWLLRLLGESGTSQFVSHDLDCDRQGQVRHLHLVRS